MYAASSNTKRFTRSNSLLYQLGVGSCYGVRLKRHCSDFQLRGMGYTTEVWGTYLKIES